jgi:hypothetical protein
MKSELYVRRYNKVRRAINRSYRQLRRQGGWRAVGKAFGIHFTMANRIGVEGYMPTDREICKALGLPWSVELEVNPKTGRVMIPKELRRKRKEAVQVDEVMTEEMQDVSEKWIEVSGKRYVFKVGDEVSFTTMRQTKNTTTFSCREGTIVGFTENFAIVKRNGKNIQVGPSGMRPNNEVGALSEYFGLGKKVGNA